MSWILEWKFKEYNNKFTRCASITLVLIEWIWGGGIQIKWVNKVWIGEGKKW
jgi:hypothetical protein